MKKISAVFDGLKFSTGTLEYSVQIAAKSNALLSGVFLDDFTYHSYKLYDMVGSQGISREKMKQLLNKDKEKRLQSAASFKFACIKEHVNHVIHHDKNIAVPGLLRQSIYSDLMLVSADETFTHIDEERPTRFIREILADIQCPVMIVPHEYRAIEKVVLLYDGKPSSVFAVKMFNYMMPWMHDITTEVVTVLDKGNSIDFPENDLMREFVTCHYPNTTYTLLYGEPEEQLISYLKKLGDALVVLGAYRRSPVSMWFKTSMADILMKETSMPLFIAHNK